MGMEIYGSLLGGGSLREGYEWYAVLTIFRRMFMAVTTVAMMTEPYLQAVLFTIIYTVSVVTTLITEPFVGGRRGGEYRFELLAESLQLATCVVPLVYFHISDSPNEGAGTAIVFCQMFLILLMGFQSARALLRSIRGVYKNRMAKRAADQERKREKRDIKSQLVQTLQMIDDLDRDGKPVPASLKIQLERQTMDLELHFKTRSSFLEAIPKLLKRWFMWSKRQLDYTRSRNPDANPTEDDSTSMITTSSIKGDSIDSGAKMRKSLQSIELGVQ